MNKLIEYFQYYSVGLKRLALLFVVIALCFSFGGLVWGIEVMLNSAAFDLAVIVMGGAICYAGGKAIYDKICGDRERIAARHRWIVESGKKFHAAADKIEAGHREINEMLDNDVLLRHAKARTSLRQLLQHLLTQETDEQTITWPDNPIDDLLTNCKKEALEDLRCPITEEVMREPIVLMMGIAMNAGHCKLGMIEENVFAP